MEIKISQEQYISLLEECKHQTGSYEYLIQYIKKTYNATLGWDILKFDHDTDATWFLLKH